MIKAVQLDITGGVRDVKEVPRPQMYTCMCTCHAYSKQHLMIDNYNN